MKYLLIALLAFLNGQQNALAKQPTAFHCQATEGSLDFTLQLGKILEHSFQQTKYFALFSTSSDGNINEQATIVSASKIATRTLVGTEYSFHLSSGESFRLKDITFVPVGNEENLGIYGVVNFPDGSQTKLSCQ